MSSLITKAGKSRSQASQKARTKKGKKAAPKTDSQSAKAAAKKPVKASSAQKPKKASASKTAKKSSASNKLAAKAKSAPTSRKTSKVASAKSGKKPAASKAASRKTANVPKSNTAKGMQSPPRKAPTSNASIALKSFEQAVKIFNRHDFAAAKAAFESLLEKFSEQLDIVALARKYLAICDQRLASVRSVPRNPDALYDQGIFEFNRGNVKDSIALFEKALKAAPKADHIFYSLAAAHARLNDAGKALEALRRAVAFQPIHRSHARQDLDFTNLHDNEAFRQLTGFGFDLSEE